MKLLQVDVAALQFRARIRWIATSRATTAPFSADRLPPDKVSKRALLLFLNLNQPGDELLLDVRDHVVLLPLLVFLLFLFLLLHLLPTLEVDEELESPLLLLQDALQLLLLLPV